MMRLSEAAKAINATFNGVDTVFSGVTTDSRKIAAGNMFVALKGERFDGHDYVHQCLEQGAVAAMVDQRSAVSSQLSAKPLLAVLDTRLGLGELAAYWRGKFNIPLAAITGSNGKTTVKEMLASILRAASSHDGVLATEGNLNNDIGLPLTLLKLRASHRYAVAEMGMNHPGEIAYLTKLAQPTVALITNAGAAHLEGLGSVEAVARAKGEIFEGLAVDGVAVINVDDAYAPLWRELAAPHKVLTFGLDNAADVSASFVLEADAVKLMLKTPEGNVDLRLGVPGKHNLKNALAASAAALAMGMPLQAIVDGLQAFGGVKGRLQRKVGCCGAVIIDDTYNANPASMRAAIGVLAAIPGTKAFVMGDMGELGDDAAALHRAIGVEAKAAGVDALYALGDMTAEAVSGFGAGAEHFKTAEELSAAVRASMAAGVTVLVKGSRFMRMERVVEALMEKEDASCC
jgi:UDP-N-acetylmuramoyl-tripeptide--D-alanyl-D-alanine ligase